MGEMTKPQAGASTPAVADADLIRTLANSQFPGAKTESVQLVLAYCRAAKLDVMKKPVHIVPLSVKLPNGKYEWRDVIMPGITLYRLQAAATGDYVGKPEPEFGPDVTEDLGGQKVTYPKWCRVTVRRLVHGQIAEFTAIELWKENYATAGRDTPAPNAMWKKRPYGQLAKVAEAQALRMAFPDTISGENTAEEMEGREIDATGMRDVTPPKEKERTKPAARDQLDGFANTKTVDAKAANEAVTGEVIDGDGVVHDMPLMPQAQATALAAGRWGGAWKWFAEVLPGIPVEARQPFWDDHADLIAKAKGYNADAKATVEALAKENGVKDE